MIYFQLVGTAFSTVFILMCAWMILCAVFMVKIDNMRKRGIDVAPGVVTFSGGIIKNWVLLRFIFQADIRSDALIDFKYLIVAMRISYSIYMLSMVLLIAYLIWITSLIHWYRIPGNPNT